MSKPITRISVLTCDNCHKRKLLNFVVIGDCDDIKEVCDSCLEILKIRHPMESEGSE